MGSKLELMQDLSAYMHITQAGAPGAIPGDLSVAAGTAREAAETGLTVVAHAIRCVDVGRLS